ncbi:McrB family protein [Persicirhabdus sediminis]|uniref:AAA+ ATPase domain-containing protein n=1 Tax=Persicirhabdus sediminis TaxID=454144 RepID=A0A8J7MCX8_9BACT|nr:hypothetical protein [Persicirhabdus sediminis]MBK1791439.1 hypothetical protein [Persicirhabdus sediminis]
MKEQFVQLWLEAGNAIIVDKQIRIANTGKAPTYALTDELLLKCAKAVSLYNEYERLSQIIKAHTDELNLTSKIGADTGSELTKDEIALIMSKLEASSRSKEDLGIIDKMLSSKKERRKEDSVGPFKQIDRKQGDQWGPALATYIGTLAADAYPNKITSTLKANPILTKDIIEQYCSISNAANLSTHPLDSALLAKPFTILTGSSGTGKTKQAESLCKHYSNQNSDNHAIVAVGADWTDNRNTLGFVNHLQKDEQNQPVYQSTEILNLLIRANADPTFPYFLILDEMNLSHVERYFADFLSVMEQKDGQFHLHDEGAELTNSATGEQKIPKKLPYPENLFVIGTVNIDETTYMFSPKVLDRANVIEFKVAKDDLENFLKEPHEYPEVERAAEGQAEAFLSLAKQARANDLPQLDANIAEKLNDHLLQLFTIMQQGRFEFAYRTANEITRYMRVSQFQLDDEDEAKWVAEGWEDSFDQQIVQKILPKLHGSIGRVGKLIARLAHFCHTPKDPDQLNDSLMEAAKLDANSAKFKRSFAKLKSMAETLQEEQFVSFIH